MIAPPAVPHAPPRGALVRFRHPGGPGEIVLDPEAGEPVVVRVAGHGASLTAALVDALDRRAGGAPGPVETGRGEVAVALEGGEVWPAPRALPSEILAGTAPGTAPCPAPPSSPELDALRAAAGPEGIEALRRFAAERHELSADRRRLERRFWALDEHLRSRARNGVLFLGAAGAGVLLALAGAVADLGGLAASGAMVGALAAAGCAVEALGRWPLREKRARLRQALATIVHREETLHDAAARAAFAAGAGDAAALADRVAYLDRMLAEAAPPAGEVPLPAIARRLAERLDLDEAEVTRHDETAPTASAVSWPADLGDAGFAATDDGDATGDATALPGLARLADRIERCLPAPWPVVLWEPWHTAPAEARARRLRALAGVLPGRPVLVLMRG